MIKEALGIPSGISDEATRISNILIDELSSYDLPDLDQYKNVDSDIKSFEMTLANIDIKIADLYHKDVEFVLEYNLIDGYNGLKPKIIKASYEHYDDIKFNTNDAYAEDMLELSFFRIKVAINPSIYHNTDTDDVVELLITNKLRFSVIIAHELKHLYDAFKERKRNLYGYGEYSAANKVLYDKSFDNTAIKRFAYLVYYTTNIENLVRPTEMYQDMVENKIKKSEFLKFIKNSNIIRTLTEAENFNIGKFERELRADSSNIDYGDDVLSYVMVLSLGKLGKRISDKLTEHINIELKRIEGDNLAKIKDTQRKSEEYFDKISKKINKYNAAKYFKEIEYKLNTVGKKLKRKLYKLYDLALDDENTKKTDYFKKNEIYKFSEYPFFDKNI